MIKKYNNINKKYNVKNDNGINGKKYNKYNNKLNN